MLWNTNQSSWFSCACIRVITAPIGCSPDTCCQNQLDFSEHFPYWNSQAFLLNTRSVPFYFLQHTCLYISGKYAYYVLQSTSLILFLWHFPSNLLQTVTSEERRSLNLILTFFICFLYFYKLLSNIKVKCVPNWNPPPWFYRKVWIRFSF